MREYSYTIRIMNRTIINWNEVIWPIDNTPNCWNCCDPGFIALVTRAIPSWDRYGVNIR